MKRLFARTWIVAAGVLFGISVAVAGLETVTHIQDLNTAWPLGSDLAATSDDHIRNIKSALKTDFPNFNGTYTSAAAPVFAIPSDADTGMYEVGANDLGFSSGGTLRFDLSTTAATLALPLTANSLAVTSSTPPTNGVFLPSANTLGFETNSAQRGTIDSNGLWSIAAPNGSNVALTVAGSANAFTAQVNGNSTSGQSRGLLVQSGTTSADFGMVVKNQAATANNFVVRGDGVLLGWGPVAATGVDLTPDASTFTATLTGCSGNCGTATARWARIGNMVQLYIPAISGTSNATTMTITGLPSAIQPANTQTTFQNCIDNSTAVGCRVTLTASSGTITLDKQNGASFTTWTNTGTKGMLTGFELSYVLN